MKILFVSHYSGLGGANRSLLDLIDALKTYSNIEVHVVLPKKGLMTDELKEREIPFKTIRYFNWVKKEHGEKFKEKLIYTIKDLLNRYATNLISKYIKKEKIELVHTNDSLTIIGFLSAKRSRIPHVWHIREFLTDDYNLTFRKSDSYVYKCFEESDKIIAISKEVKDFYHYKINREINVIYNGIPQPTNFSINNFKKFTIMFAGGSKVEKGIWDVLKAANLLKEVYPNFDFNILIAGTFKNKVMEDYINEKYLSENIQILGNIDNIEEYRKKAHIFLVCSKREAFGRVTVEAMFDKVPVIASNSGANPEIIKHNHSGVLYEIGDFVSLSKKIKELHDNNNFRTILSNRGFISAKNNFEINITAKKILKMYKTLI